MLSKKAFARGLNDFETTYKKCLNTLLTLTGGDPKAEDLARFQPSLYHALLELSHGYHQVRRERDRLIGRKGQYSETWHDLRQRTLAGRQEIITRAILLGRMLGDSFVWFFYRNDPALLQAHARQPRPSLPPAGDGGEGELALIDAVRFFGDKYILFHGITTMFRLGDASLADLATQRIVGIGELKTTRIDKNRLNMHFQASMQHGVSITPLAPAPADMAMPPPKQRARLDKQMARISRAAADADRPPHVKIEINVGDMAYVGELNALVPQAIRGKVAMRQMSPGLVVLAYCSGQRTLLSRLQNITSIPKDALSGLTEFAKNVMLDGSAHNMLLINRAFYSDTWEPVVMAGATPMLMWHLDAEVKRVLATGEVVIVTLFNPAHVFRDFIEQGWSFGRFSPPTEFSLRRERNGKTMEIGNVQYFLQLISNALYREDYVSRLVVETWTRMEAADLTGERIDLNFTHHVYF